MAVRFRSKSVSKIPGQINRRCNTSDQIYCFKCRSKTDTLEAQEVVLKNGRPAVTGQCVACGTKKFRMGAARK